MNPCGFMSPLFKQYREYNIQNSKPENRSQSYHRGGRTDLSTGHLICTSIHFSRHLLWKTCRQGVTMFLAPVPSLIGSRQMQQSSVALAASLASFRSWQLWQAGSRAVGMKKRGPRQIWPSNIAVCTISMLEMQYMSRQLGLYLNMFSGQALKYSTQTWLQSRNSMNLQSPLIFWPRQQWQPISGRKISEFRIRQMQLCLKYSRNQMQAKESTQTISTLRVLLMISLPQNRTTWQQTDRFSMPDTVKKASGLIMPNRLRSPMMISTMEISRVISTDRIRPAFSCRMLVYSIWRRRRDNRNMVKATTAKMNEVAGLIIFVQQEMMMDSFQSVLRAIRSQSIMKCSQMSPTSLVAVLSKIQQEAFLIPFHLPYYLLKESTKFIISFNIFSSQYFGMSSSTTRASTLPLLCPKSVKYTKAVPYLI